MNLSETAFLTPVGDAWGLRWFTPEVEIDLCGHATLASAHLLYETGRLAEGAPARFDTRSGRLTVRQHGDAYVMDFPATPPEAADPPEGLTHALGVAPVWTGRSRFDVFAVLEDEAAVYDLVPDHTALARLDARGVIVTARAGRQPGADVVSRFSPRAAGCPKIPSPARRTAPSARTGRAS